MGRPYRLIDDPQSGTYLIEHARLSVGVESVHDAAVAPKLVEKLLGSARGHERLVANVSP